MTDTTGRTVDDERRHRAHARCLRFRQAGGVLSGMHALHLTAAGIRRAGEPRLCLDANRAPCIVE